MAPWAALGTRAQLVIIIAMLVVVVELAVLSTDKELRARIFRYQILLVGEMAFIWGEISYLWKTCVGIGSSHTYKLVYGTLLVFAALSLPATPFVTTEPHSVSVVFYISFGAVLQQMLCLLTLDCVSFMRKLFTGREISISIKAIIVIIYSVLVTTYGFSHARQSPAIKTVQLSIPNWPKSLSGTSVVQLSDIHVGPTVGRSMLTKLVTQVDSLNPDIVVITGDLVDGQVDQIMYAVAPLKNLKTKYGVFFVTGNHEYYTGDVDKWFSYLKDLNVTVLHNSNVAIGKEPQTFCLAGVDDITANRISYGDHGMDLVKAVGSCKKGGAIVLLAHQPKAAKKAVASEYNISLILSGHTHGGQMFPLQLGAYLLNPYFKGLYYDQGTYIYVSEGTFYWGIPMRVGSSMEITQFVIR